MSGDRRGQSAVLAVVLLFGLTAVASVMILVIGAPTAAHSQDAVEVERAETGMVEVGDRIDAVGYGEEPAGTVDLDLPDRRGDLQKRTTGRITIVRDNGTTLEIVNQTVGSVVYTHESEQFAYQAGGVWHGTGNETRLLSGPEVSARGGTLTMRITDVEEGSHVDTGPVTVRHLETTAPLNDEPIEPGEIVTVRIESDYYVGWAQYLRQRVEGAVVTVDHDDRAAIVTMAQPLAEDPFRSDAAAGAEFDPGIVGQTNVTIDVSNADYPQTRVEAGDEVDGKSVDNLRCDEGTGNDCVTIDDPELVELDRAIHLKALSWKSRCQDSHPHCEASIDDRDTYVNDQHGGTYYVEGDSVLTNHDTVTIDLSQGNVTLVVDGHVALAGGTIRTINGDASDNYARIYLNHSDLGIAQKGSFYAESDNASRLQVYGTSETHVDVGQVQNGEGFVAAVYAPGDASEDYNRAVDLHSAISAAGCDSNHDSYDVCAGTGGGTVKGALIGGSVGLTQSTDFEYDDSLSSIQPTVSPESEAYPPRINYLHASLHEVSLESE